MEAGKVGSFRQDQLLAAVATSLTRSEAAVLLTRGTPSSAAALPLLCTKRACGPGASQSLDGGFADTDGKRRGRISRALLSHQAPAMIWQGVEVPPRKPAAYGLARRLLRVELCNRHNENHGQLQTPRRTHRVAQGTIGHACCEPSPYEEADSRAARLSEESPNDTEGENAGNHELIQEPGHLTTAKYVHEHQADRQGDR